MFHVAHLFDDSGLSCVRSPNNKNTKVGALISIFQDVNEFRHGASEFVDDNAQQQSMEQKQKSRDGGMMASCKEAVYATGRYLSKQR
jgi:hypothetical protein